MGLEYSRIEDGLIALGYTPERNNMSQHGDRLEIAKFYEDFSTSFPDGVPPREDILNGSISWSEIEEDLESVIIARTRFAITQNPPTTEFAIERHQQRLSWLCVYTGEIDGDRGRGTREAEETFRQQYLTTPEAAPTPAPTPIPSTTPVTPERAPTPTIPRSDNNFTVYLDPGHGYWQPWYDGGAEIQANGATRYEADIVLRQALAVAEELESRGIRVVMTRRDEENIGLHADNRVDTPGDGIDMTHGRGAPPLQYRVDTALSDLRRVGGQGLFISLHADKAENTSVSRVGIFYDRGAQRGGEFANILADEFNTDGVNQGGRYGVDSDDAVVRDHRNLLVTRETRAGGLPAVLVELGFLSNEDDYNRLNSSDQRNNTALQIAEAVDRYRGR